MSISKKLPLIGGNSTASDGADVQAAERHLAALRKHHPARVAENRVPHPSLSRRIRRLLARERERLSSKLEEWRRAWDAPHRKLGWVVARARLLRRPTIGPSTILALVIAALVVAAVTGSLPVLSDTTAKVVGGLFLGGAVTGLVVSLWGDLFRLPWHARRIRRRIVAHPWSVLPTTARRPEAELMARDDSTHMVPRQELYDELLPGILERSRRDTQLVVGEPGAGKTTALVGISELLARIGIVPVVVPLWGEMPENLVDNAKQRFIQHARSLVHSEPRLEELWQWLRTHRRLVILVDDLDRIAPDGDRGFLLRRALEELAGEGLPAVVTTRPAGIPAGLAASAVSLGSLDEGAAARHVLRVAREQTGVARSAVDTPKVRGRVDLWIKEGRLAEVPFYLELLARLVAAGRCEELAPASALADETGVGKVRRRADGKCEWDPLWVRFRLLERFHDGIAVGAVHRWLGIDERERRSCLASLSEAGLAQLKAVALAARASAGNGDAPPARTEIESFLDVNDRFALTDEGTRMTVSAHEAINTAERLRILDRDPGGRLHFSHRILQAFLAGRYLETVLSEPDPCRSDDGRGWIADLLDPRHPERMTANMTLVFASLRASERERNPVDADDREEARKAIQLILARLVEKAGEKLPDDDPLARAEERRRRLDPSKSFDPEWSRSDPDDALSKLTTTAEIAAATGKPDRSSDVLEKVKAAQGATRWTKLNAIPAIASLPLRQGSDGEQWTRIWEFARDPDHEVRRAASAAIADDAFRAYKALEEGVEAMIARAALKSARDLPLDIAGDGALEGGAGEAAWRLLEEKYDLEDERDEVRSLKALGWVLPAIVSGLREHPASPASARSRRRGQDGEGPDGNAPSEHEEAAATVPSREEYDERLRGASRALDRLATLAFQKKFPELEAAVAQGFKNDAMRHADDPEERSGPGLVESNRQLVTDVCLDNARHWYARMILHQALSLYTVAGSDAEIAFSAYARVRDDGEPHPLVKVAAQQAQRVVIRHRVANGRWTAFVWADEGEAVSRRQPSLNPTAAQLVGDVTLLLNLNETAPEDRRARFARMSRLPYCLRESRDRLEILGAGCPEGCAYGFCPLREAPVDEPDGQRTISRAFCRGQQALASRDVPPWQKHMGKKNLKRFWIEMERRART
jgi:AAA domain-containing protein